MKTGSRATAPEGRTAPSDARRKYDPEQTKRNILDVATQEFSAIGLAGARVDAPRAGALPQAQSLSL